MRFGTVVLTVGVALAAQVAAGAGSAVLPRTAAAQQQVAPTTPADSATRQRPFDHIRHQAVSCIACHGSGNQHRTILIRTPRDCASCHHAPQPDAACARCHSATTLAADRHVRVAMRLPGWDTPGARMLPFSHRRHVGAGVSCRSCHQEPVTLAMTRSCGSCHEHHRPEAVCTACHVSPRTDVHRAEAHLSCTGSGCHAIASGEPARPSRAVCLTCHVAQTAHEPTGVCATCHRVPAAPFLPAPRAPVGSGRP